MTTDTHTRRRHTPLAVLLAALAFILTTSIASADPPGNNGTVKVHSGTGATEPANEMANDSHVTCPFHLHFYGGDAGQSGEWSVAAVNDVGFFSGTYVADGNGEAESGEVFMAAGHYRVSWQGHTEDSAKHKTFWVEGECEGGPGG